MVYQFLNFVPYPHKFAGSGSFLEGVAYLVHNEIVSCFFTEHKKSEMGMYQEVEVEGTV